MKRYLLILLILAITTISFVQCSRVAVDYSTNILQSQVQGAFIYSPQSSVPHSKPGQGFSYFNATLALSLLYPDQGINFETQQAAIDILIFRDGAPLGVTYDGVYSLCCSQTLFSLNICPMVGAVIVPYATKNASISGTNFKDFYSETADVASHHITVHSQLNVVDNVQVPVSFEITDTGIYYAFLLSCNQQLNVENNVYLSAKGDILFMNPFGYISGELFPLIYFDLILALAYIGLGILWVVLFLRYRSTALRVQYWISLVIVLGFLESITDYADLSAQNKTGYFSYAGLFFTAFLGTLKRGFARSLVLIVSMGYGTVVPTLPKNVTLKIVAITLAYIVFRGVYAYLSGLPRQSQSQAASGVLLQLPVAILDALFYFWTLMSLSEILKRLSERSQNVKIQMFRKFIWVLIYSISVTCVIIIIQLFCNWVKSTEFNIKYSWVLTAFWDTAYFAVLGAICWIWKPNENNQQFAYSELDTEDSVVMESTGGGVVTQRNSSQYDADGNKIDSPNESTNSFTIVESLDDEMDHTINGDDDEFDKKDLADRYFKSF
ncbi:hypothetical protein CYY_001135 [Polysphondylium violaceum]|uniref:GOST seven transmembrane domain-containing protein n=1 Tax=Polysphondylium violaceum TaxID=133409 RepID=A0A8J4V1W4_9MYCE|nr:hypothetical protein CYY_001135 [Polysphondylium violaceum]